MELKKMKYLFKAFNKNPYRFVEQIIVLCTNLYG